MKSTIMKIFVAIFITAINFNCSQEDENQQTPEQSLESVLLEVKNYSIENNNTDVAFTLNRNNELFSINTIEVMRSNRTLSRRQGDRFHIACFDEDGNETSYTICPDEECASIAILECADNGGCAEICEVQALYLAPPN